MAKGRNASRGETGALVVYCEVSCTPAVRATNLALSAPGRNGIIIGFMVSIEKNQLVIQELEFEKGNWGGERENEHLMVHLLYAQCLASAGQTTDKYDCVSGITEGLGIQDTANGAGPPPIRSLQPTADMK